MGEVVAGVELFDREVVNPNELHTLVNEVLRSIGGEVGVILDKILLRKERRVAGAKKDSRLTFDVVGAELRRANGADLVGKAQKKRGSDQALERNLVDGLAIVEEMTRGVGVCAGMRSKPNRRDIRTGALRNGLLERDVNLGIPRVDEAARSNGH